MEVSGTLLRQVSYVAGAGTDTRSSFSRRSIAACAGASYHPRGGVKVLARPRKVSVSGELGSGFRDEGHLQYYHVSPSPRCGGKDKTKGSGVMTTTKKLKLLKGLTQGLTLFPELGFTMDPEKRTLLDEVQGKLTSDAAEALLKQLEQLRAREKELKKQRKQEKAKLKASKMKTEADCESSSSSSESSESSDSDCGEVVDMNNLRAGVASATVIELQPPAQEVTMLPSPFILPQTATAENPLDKDLSMHHHAKELCSRNKTYFSSTSVDVVTTAPQKRIEVCMGNKCRRSGADALLQEFERVMGAEGGAVVGCKCMGKCKSGPNVRIQNSVEDALVEGLRFC